MKPGEIIMIYCSPYRCEHPEGRAKLIRHINDVYRCRPDENELEWPIPYELKVCMATFEVRKQTTEKMVELPVIWLTSDEP